MVVERYLRGPGPVYSRVEAKGRMLPDGLRYVDSWVVDDVPMDRCFQLMETDDPVALRRVDRPLVRPDRVRGLPRAQLRRSRPARPGLTPAVRARRPTRGRDGDGRLLIRRVGVGCRRAGGPTPRQGWGRGVGLRSSGALVPIRPARWYRHRIDVRRARRTPVPRYGWTRPTGHARWESSAGSAPDEVRRHDPTPASPASSGQPSAGGVSRPAWRRPRRRPGRRRRRRGSGPRGRGRRRAAGRRRARRPAGCRSGC